VCARGLCVRSPDVIYEDKVRKNATIDKANKNREPLPDFIKNYMIRQFGLKSIAMKNLQNLAAGAPGPYTYTPTP